MNNIQYYRHTLQVKAEIVELLKRIKETGAQISVTVNVTANLGEPSRLNFSVPLNAFLGRVVTDSFDKLAQEALEHATANIYDAKAKAREDVQTLMTEFDLSPVKRHSVEGRPSDAQIVDLVNSNNGHMSALDILDHFLSKGYKEREIQTALQIALDRGLLKLGDKLHLYTK